MNQNIMANVWTPELTLEFIQLYKDEAVLWDPKHPYHKNRVEVAEAWNRVQANLSETFEVEDLKRKKESVMSSYRVQIRKKRKSHGEYRSTWFAFPLMDSFLGSLDQFEYENANSSQDTDHEYLEDQDYKPHVEFVTQKPSTTDIKYVVVNSRTPNLKRQSVNTSYESSGTFGQATTSGVASTAGMDECDLYTHLLAKKLRRLDEEQRDMAMHAIDNIMFQAKAAMRNKSAKRQRQRDTKSPMFVLTRENEMLKCYDKSDPMEDEIDETLETLEECDDE